jgi:hypothetical protein
MRAIKFLSLLVSFTFFTSCLDVVEVDLEEATPRTVIDASIKWENNTNGNSQVIEISRTRNFFEDEIIRITDANVEVIGENNESYLFEETEPGIYTTTSFSPELNATYQLNIISNGVTYEATEQFVNPTLIDSITQNDDGGFTGGEKEVTIYFKDNPEEENYYLARFNTDFLAFPEVEIQSDEFNNGNTISFSFSDEELETGDIVDIEFYTISKSYYDFLFRLLLQSGSAGGPFQAQPATVRGNIINQDNFDNFPFGYFSLSTFEKESVTIE